MSNEFGLRSYQGDDGSMVKPFSEHTAQKIDEEVKSLVDGCYKEVEQLLTEKKELIESLAERLLDKESINLPEIISVIGDRPFPMKESIKNYLSEMKEREEKAEQEKKEQEEAAEKGVEDEEAVKEEAN